MSRSRIIFEAPVKNGSTDGNKGRIVFLITEAALFEHPKSYSSPPTVFPRSHIRFDASLRTPDSGKGIKFMAAKLYIGNLSFNTTTQDLEEMCGEFGTVQSVNIIEDRETGRSRGFAFVEMSSDEEAQNAISALNGKEIDGRSLTVNEAKEREAGGGGRGGGGGGRGGRR